MRLLLARYGGRLTNLLASARNVEDAKTRLQQFRGVGPKTAGIFLRAIDTRAVIGTGACDGPVTLSRADLEGQTVSELHERAKRLRIPDRSRMSKKELLSCLAPFYAGE